MSIENYVVHFILGRAAEEELKLCRWPQWQQCISFFDEILAPYAKTAYVTSEQNYKIILPLRKNDDPQYRRCNWKKVPGLSRLKWNIENNERWSRSLDIVEPNPIELDNTRIFSSKEHDKDEKLPDICIILGDQNPLKNVLGEYIKNPYVYNQSLTISINEKIYGSRSTSDWNTLIVKLSRLMNAVRIGRTTRPWVISEIFFDPPGSKTKRMRSSCLGFDSFKNGNSIDFENYFQKWEYLDLDNISGS